jgi:hypothetical protein
MLRIICLFLLMGLGGSVVGCAGSDPEPPKESIPDIPAGRGTGGGKMPTAPKGVGGPAK